MKYIVLLRGINVSGQKIIKMADLREHLSKLPFKNVQTYIQSGNIILETDIQDSKEVEVLIHNKIKEVYGWEVPTLCLSASSLNLAISSFPYIKDPDRNSKCMFITFLAKKPDEEYIQKILEFSFDQEEYIIDGTNIYGYSGVGFAKAKMSNNFFEKKLKVRATTRNWRTVNVLLGMIEG